MAKHKADPAELAKLIDLIEQMQQKKYRIRRIKDFLKNLTCGYQFQDSSSMTIQLNTPGNSNQSEFVFIPGVARELRAFMNAEVKLLERDINKLADQLVSLSLKIL